MSSNIVLADPTIQFVASSRQPASTSYESTIETKQQKVIQSSPEILISKLQQFTYNGMKIDVSELNFSTKQNLVTHHFPKLNGDFIESISCSGEKISVSIPCFNSQIPGIYPTLRNEFRTLQLSKNYYQLLCTHGEFSAFVENISETQSSNDLTGVLLKIDFAITEIYTAGQEDEETFPLLSESDFSIKADEIKKKLPPAKQSQWAKDTSVLQDFQNATQKVNATIGLVLKTQNKYIGKYRNVVGACNRVIDQLTIFKESQFTYIAMFMSDVRRIQNIYVKLLQNINKSSSSKTNVENIIKTYLVPKRMMKIELIKRLNITSERFTELNSELETKAFIEKYTRVRY